MPVTPATAARQIETVKGRLNMNALYWGALRVRESATLL
jgi:hypothetical protein